MGNGFNDEIDSSFRQKADMANVFVRQLDRKNHQGSTDYPNSVIITLNNLPQRWRSWVLEQDSDYSEDVPTLVFKTFCGVRLGSRDEPLLKDKKQGIPHLENGEIDYNHPNVISPKWEIKTHTDYTVMDAIVAQAAEYASLTWTQDPLEQDAGDTEEYIIERKATPYQPQIQDTEG